MAAIAAATSLEELVSLHKAQGEKVKELKTKDKSSPECATAVKELIEIKKKIAELDAEHPLALKKKEKKKKNKKAKGDAGVDKKAARIAARKAAMEKAAAEKAKKAAALGTFGNADVMQSQKITGRTWTRVEDLTEATAGQKVLVRARVHTLRGQSKFVFFLFRQACYTVQGVLARDDKQGRPQSMLKFCTEIPRESIVDIEGVVTKTDSPVTSATQSAVELQIHTIFVISRSAIELPFQVQDASTPGSYPTDDAPTTESEEAGKGDSVIKVNLDTRLDYRWIDMRTPVNQSILRINSGVCRLFREFLTSKGFVEQHSPKVNAGASEGGAEVFRLKYMEGTRYEQQASLAQSPQLYKQMISASGDFERVFEIGPVFRAEESFTRRHLTEFTGLDMEMAINEHYWEVLEVLSDLFIYIFAGLNRDFKHEINIIAQMFPVQPFKWLNPSLRLTWKEGVELLNAHGLTQEERDMGCTPQDMWEDLSTPNERLLGRIVREKYDTDFYILDEWPISLRPFYTMPNPHDPRLSNSYDIMMRGEEIMSGAQRVHDVDLLLRQMRAQDKDGKPLSENMRAHGMPMDEESIASIQGYVDCFRHGSYPHGGGGVGLERVVMLFLGLPNVRLATFFPRDPSRLTP